MGLPGYTAIEIPDGWGSQAATGYFLQSAAAFRDPRKISELYHEIGHRWNAKAAPELQRCRWFDEAFASYFAALAVRQFQGDAAFQEQMEHARSRFLSDAAKDPRVASTPIVEYGRIEIGENSYTKGAWSLYVLHELIGTPEFNKTVSTVVHDFQDKPANFSDFVRIAEQVSGRSLQKYAQEWLYGTESSQLLSGKQPIGVIVARYR
ncbi:MAG: M1 family aminopeptidase [Candidatus Acidiferrum sp.]